MAGVKGITFDVFGTLFDWYGSLVPRVESMLRESGAAVNVESFMTVWRTKQLSYTQINTMLGKGWMSFREITERALRYTIKTFAVSVSSSALSELISAWYELRPFPDVIPALRRLSEMGYMLAPLSNGDNDMLQSLVKRLDVRFDAIFSAENVGVYKPHPAIYEQAVKAWNIRPEEIMHVAGSPFDAIGSKSYGLKTVWVNRQSSVFDEFDQRPDSIVRDFEELVGVLRT
ncbi:MAG: haloacid dehalogenase type II [Aigarchaeota archaeon]|nr:haloacid dehalogenase type II [Candidatus Pelearchaeum maunauluense]